MKIPLKISETMTQKNKWFGSIERTLIRIPEKMRENLGFLQGDFIGIRDKSGKEISLQITNAYKEDAESDQMRAYVTEDVFLALDIKEDRLDQEIELVAGITLGCDPEFFLIRKDTGEIVHAGKFFTKWADVGYDHDGLLMEIRPMPSTSEVLLSHNIFNLLNKAKDTIDHSNLLFRHLIGLYGASSYGGMTAGFHLHYGLPKQLLRTDPKTRLITLQIIKVLDYYVGLPAIIPEGIEDSKRRTQPFVEYGKPGGYRIDSRTLEYRVPGGSLLRHPVLTRGLLGLGATVVEDVVSRIKNYTNNYENLELLVDERGLKEIYPHLLNIHDLFYAICSTDIRVALNQMSTIIDDVQSMISYENRKGSIEPFFNAILMNQEFGREIDKNWRRFYYEEQQRQVGFFSTSAKTRFKTI
jgi:hypothetical protein